VTLHPARADAGRTQEIEARVEESAARGDYGSAVTALIEGYGPQVMSYLRQVIKDPDEAEDAFALFTLNVWRGFPGWERRASARAWAYSVAWNAAGRSFRDPWRRRRERLPSSVAASMAAARTASSGLDRERDASGLEEFRATLGPEELSLLVLRIDRGLSWREVAVAMGEPDDDAHLAALRKRFERLKEKLGRWARDRGLLPRA
jgi:RNA polymerase sigma-70 factor (ECF subfamily)